jgi:hypothetical protein
MPRSVKRPVHPLDDVAALAEFAQRRLGLASIAHWPGPT